MAGWPDGRVAGDAKQDIKDNSAKLMLELVLSLTISDAFEPYQYILNLL